MTEHRRRPEGGGAGEAGPGGGGGVRFSSASPLVARAVEELRGAPHPPEELARKVLGVRNAPSALADRVVSELLEGRPDVELREGRWHLARGEPPRGPLREMDYVVVDLETTGTTPSRGHRVTEVAAVQVSDGRVVGEFSSLVDPGRPIPPSIQELTGITDAMVADAPPFEEVCDLLRERMEGRIFVAHNVPFDWRFLTAEMRRARSLLPEGPRLCTLRLARRALPGLPRKGLDAVARHYGIEVEARHRAMGDALATADLLLELLEEVDGLGVSDWEVLREWLAGRREVAPGPDGRAPGAPGAGDGPGGGAGPDRAGPSRR